MTDSITKTPPPRPPRVGRPQYVGITTYQDPQGRFEFKYAADWTTDELADDREGVIAMPEPDEPATYFAVWIEQLGEHVVAEDLPVVAEGLSEGLSKLPELELLHSDDAQLDNLLRLERLYTFRDEAGFVRKRRTWTLYVDTWQMVVVFQASSIEEYAYWEPMGNFAFARFQIPETLWFATDRELSPYTGTPGSSADAEGSADAGSSAGAEGSES